MSPENKLCSEHHNRHLFSTCRQGLTDGSEVGQLKIVSPGGDTTGVSVNPLKVLWESLSCMCPEIFYDPRFS